MISRLTTQEYLPGVLIINIAKSHSHSPLMDSAEWDPSLTQLEKIHDLPAVQILKDTGDFVASVNLPADNA